MAWFVVIGRPPPVLSSPREVSSVLVAAVAERDWVRDGDHSLTTPGQRRFVVRPVPRNHAPSLDRRRAKLR